MTDSSPYRQLCSLLEQNPVLQENNKRRAWVAAADLVTLESRLLFDEPAIVFVPSLLRAIVEVGGDDVLRCLLTFLRDDSDYGYSGHPSTVAWLTTLLTEPDLFIGLKAAIIAPPITDTLTAAIAHFDTLPTNIIPPITPLPTPHKMPLPSNRDFVGREDELKAISRAVKTGQVAAVVAAGIGGVGKTQLAVEWVHRYGQYFKGGVFWLDFSRPDDVPLEVATAGAEYRLEGYNGLEIEAKVQAVKRQWAEPTPTLLIFDNCEDPALAQAYLPTTGGARILLTSRDQTWTTTLRRVQQIPIETLPRDKSIELLHKFRPDPAMTDKIAGEIAEELGDLPLALHMAGTFLARYQTAYKNPQTYVEELSAPDLLAKLGKQAQRLKNNETTRHEWDVARTFLISIERLAQHPHAEWIQEVLGVIAHFSHGTPIPTEWLLSLLPEGIDRLDGADALAQLLSAGVVDAPQSDTVRMHRLVAQVVLATATPEATAAARSRSETVIVAVKPTYGEANFVAQMEVWLPHSQYILNRALPRGDVSSLIIGGWTGFLLEKLGFYERVQEIYEEILSISRNILGINHPDTLKILNNLALLYKSRGLYELALPLGMEALNSSREVFETRHPNIAISLTTLAGIYELKGLDELVLPLYEEALDITRESLGSDHPQTAMCLNNLASAYRTIGWDDQALEMYKEAIEIQKQTLGLRHPSIAISLNNLAGLYRIKGLDEHALSLYEEVLEIQKETQGDRHPHTVKSRNNLASLYSDKGLYTQALRLYETALDISREVLGPRHHDTATSLNNLAHLYQTQGLYELAMPLYEEALEIIQGVLGKHHPNTAQAMNNLATLYESQGLHERARLLYEDALEIRRKVGVLHPTTANILNNLSDLCKLQGLTEYALQLCMEALEINREVLGTRHPSTATNLIRLATLYELQGNYVEALPVIVEALAIRREVLGEHHLDTAHAIWWLAHLEYVQKEYTLALNHYEEALSIFVEQLGAEHPTTQQCRNQRDICRSL